MKKDFLTKLFCGICAVSCVTCVLYSCKMQSVYTIRGEEALKIFAGMHEDARGQLPDITKVNQSAAEVTVDIPQVPVILSEDGSFWYDQEGNGITLEAAEEFLDEHYGYCVNILNLNANDRYLSAWQGEERLGKLDEVRETLIVSKDDSERGSLNVSDDQILQDVADSVLNCPMSMELYSEMAERLPNNMASECISELVVSIWRRKVAEDYNAVDYIFWSTVAQLVHDKVYSVDEINQQPQTQATSETTSEQRRSSKPSKSGRTQTTTKQKDAAPQDDVSGNQASASVSVPAEPDDAFLSNYDNMTDAEIIESLGVSNGTFDRTHPHGYFDEDGQYHDETAPGNYYATSDGLVFEIVRGRELHNEEALENLIERGEAVFVGTTERRLK